ncbi:MAG: DUF2911 domain-containing protein [Bacteroidetes bacterium]|nr:DUF2911 domain-containing protein [Bacteroidota bacterium]
MKKSILILSSILVFSLAQSQTISFPQASPTTTVSQNFATSKIELSYSRPSAKGRKIYGDVVPFGSIWRTGANNATTISFGEDVKINNTEIKSGKYGLLTIPGATEWTIILTKDLTVTNAQAYKQENDVLRFSVKPETLPYFTETFEIEIANVKTNQVDIELIWEKTSVSFTIKTDLDSKLSKQIAEVMGKDSRPYYQSANWYYENGKDLKTAYEWVNKAVDANPNAFWVLHLKAKIQKSLKDYNAAIATATISLEKAKADGDEAYVKNNEKLINDIKALPDYSATGSKKKK